MTVIERPLHGEVEIHRRDVWTERRRNLVPAPRPTVYAGSGWAASAVTDMAANPGWVGGVITAATTFYVFTSGSSRAYAAGEKVTLSVRYKVTARGAADPMHVAVMPHVRTGNVYFREGEQVVRPIVVGQVEDVVIQWRTPVAIPAGQLDVAVVGAAPTGGGFMASYAGFGMMATRALIEDGHTDGRFFDGGLATGDPHTRNRWLGAVQASVSVQEDENYRFAGKATRITARRGGARTGLGVKTDVGLLTFELLDSEDPMRGGTFQPGQEVRAVSRDRAGNLADLFTGRVVDVASAYPLNKSTGRQRTVTTVTVADAVKVHGETPRYGVTIAERFETFESRIKRLAGSALAPIDPPVEGAPREVYAL